MKSAFLGLGSNLGDRVGHLTDALSDLAADPAISIVIGSSLYESKPVGMVEQPDFLNMVVQVETGHPPLALLDACLGVEARLGRKRRERWGPRIIDVDVLVYDQLLWKDDRLVLPHPRMHERSFVLTPLAEIAPALKINGVGAHDLAERAGAEGLGLLTSWNKFAETAGLPWRSTQPPC
jgi:2-amino-4-hydroxy-6-hydroxymethyldihydropteridine diphosphokinase